MASWRGVDKPTVQTLIDIANGPAYAMDIHLAHAFAELTGRPETEVLNVLRREFAETLAVTHGRGRHKQAMLMACGALVYGYTDANECHVDDIVTYIYSRSVARSYGFMAAKWKVMQVIPLSQLCVIVGTDRGQWAKADTIEAALKSLKAKPGTQYTAHIAHKDTSVDGLGRFCYPSSPMALAFDPKLISKKVRAKK